MTPSTEGMSRSDQPLSLREPIDVSGLGRDEDSLREAKRAIRERLNVLREAFPQIPADAKRLDGVVDRLLDVVLEATHPSSGSMARLSRGLQELQIKGLGQANRLWRQLFVMSRSDATTDEVIDVAGAPREELSRVMRALLHEHFEGRPTNLEWAIAAILAWRPASLRDLHGLLKKADPMFPELDSFESRHGRRFLFESDEQEQSPDWTVLWEYEGKTGYGGGYPADVRNFLVSFLTDVKALEPGAAILDIGTGNHGSTLLAREISADFELCGIDVARLPAPPESARIRTFRMSAERLGFHDCQFAAVMSVNGIEYADIDQAVPEMHRVMRPGAPGALVLHRPDSLIVGSSRKFLDFVRAVPLMETLALTWLYVCGGSESVRRQIQLRLEELRRIEVTDDFGRYFRAVLDGIPEAIGLRATSPQRARQMVERFEKDLGWRRQRDQFMVAHMTRIPSGREELGEWLRHSRFAVDAVSEVFHDHARNQAPLGWAVRFHKPRDG
jgi:methyltransferase family protein